METKHLYTKADCVETGYDCFIKGRVVVLDKKVLPQGDGNQLFYCVSGEGANVNPTGQSVFLLDLTNGVFGRWKRSDVVGMLKPELLPDSAKLQLSQLRPEGALDVGEHEARYSGYSFLPDGRYASGVWLCTEQEVVDYIEMQMRYQYRIMICDRNDFCVFEMQEQKVIYPTKQEIAELFSQDHPGGQTMT